MSRNDPLYPQPEFDSLRELLELRARQTPDRVAFQDRRGKELLSLTYGALLPRVRQAAGMFPRQKGEKIGILGENSLGWVLSWFGAALSGNVAVPLDKELQEPDLAELLRFAGATWLVYSDTYSRVAKALGERLGLTLIPMKRVLEAQEEAPLPETPGTELCAIIFTSGTTGKPKGVMLSQRNLARDARSAAQNVKVVGPGLVTLPLHHTFAFTAGVLGPIVWAQPVCFSRSLRTFQGDLAFFRPQHIFVVPLYVESMGKMIWDGAKKQGKEAQLRKLTALSNGLRRLGIDLRGRLFRQVRQGFGGDLTLLISGGAPLRPGPAQELEQFGIQVLNGYGITECSPVVAVNRNRSHRLDSAGLVLSVNQVRIREGEIQVRGDNVMLGYYGEPEATDQAFEDGWFRTGDLGRLDSEGFLCITGRKKNLIIAANGENVSPEELEGRIAEVPGVQEVLVYGENGAIVAEIFPEGPEEAIREAVFALNQSLPAYKHIQKVRFRDVEFPKTTTRKVKRGQAGQQARGEEKIPAGVEK